MFDVSLSRIAGLPVLRLHGALVMGTPVETLDATVRELLASNETRVIVDVASMAQFDSSGLGTLVALQRDLRRASGGIVLVGPSERLRSALGTMHVDSMFQIAETVTDAARLLAVPPT
jgi:anti-anti-sigma factor